MIKGEPLSSMGFKAKPDRKAALPAIKQNGPSSETIACPG